MCDSSDKFKGEEVKCFEVIDRHLFDTSVTLHHQIGGISLEMSQMK